MMARVLNSRSCGLVSSEKILFINCLTWIYFLAVFMYLSERYLEMLQNTDVEEPKSSQHKNGKVNNKFCFCWRNIVS